MRALQRPFLSAPSKLPNRLICCASFESSANGNRSRRHVSVLSPRALLAISVSAPAAAPEILLSRSHTRSENLLPFKFNLRLGRQNPWRSAALYGIGTRLVSSSRQNRIKHSGAAIGDGEGVTRLDGLSTQAHSHFEQPLSRSARAWIDSVDWSTPLAKELAETIEATGPISVASFMRQCLTSPDRGYYTASRAGITSVLEQGRQEEAKSAAVPISSLSSSTPDQFGASGDFVTSPEISQVFGELVGIWFVTEWIAQGRPSKNVQIIELGPGRGTLMNDVLRTIKSFPPLAAAISGIHLVEASPTLQAKQADLLGAPFRSSSSSPSPSQPLASKLLPDVSIHWHTSLSDVPTSGPATSSSASPAPYIPFIIAHEFFDALPIHVFRATIPDRDRAGQGVLLEDNPNANKALGPAGLDGKGGTKRNIEWRELLVAPIKTVSSATASFSSSASPSSSFRSSTSASTTTPPITDTSSSQKATVGTISRSNAEANVKLDPDRPHFHLVPASTATPQSLYLPELSDRYKRLKGTPGATIEICPEGLVIAAEIGARIGGQSRSALSPAARPRLPKHEQAGTRSGRSGTPTAVPSASAATNGRNTGAAAGAALLIDYGPSATIPQNSLRGIRSHSLVSPFSQPGLVDLSADVDFTGLAEATLEASEQVEVHGPVEQGGWLHRLGGGEYVDELVRRVRARAGTGGKASVDGGNPSGLDSDVEKEVTRIVKAWQRLTDRGPRGMGGIYKVMAVVPERSGLRPVGFGGSVQE